MPKLIGEPNPPFDPLDEGSFGNRPLFREDLLVGDILSALRLFKPGLIHIAGFATWTDCPWVLGGISFRILGRWPCHGQFELSAGEVEAFRELWQLLEGEGKRFAFSVDRFNLAFDRGLLNDRLVDLVIAAESLFLGDQNKDRGELGYRLALRAAKFIEHPDYNEKDIFRTMREAYNARSAIVHGGSPTQTRFPHNRDANLVTVMEAFEDLVRRGLRKALDMKSDGRMLREPAYWEDLVLSGPRPR